MIHAENTRPFMPLGPHKGITNWSYKANIGIFALAPALQGMSTCCRAAHLKLCDLQKKKMFVKTFTTAKSNQSAKNGFLMKSRCNEEQNMSKCLVRRWSNLNKLQPAVNCMSHLKMNLTTMSMCCRFKRRRCTRGASFGNQCHSKWEYQLNAHGNIKLNPSAK